MSIKRVLKLSKKVFLEAFGRVLVKIAACCFEFFLCKSPIKLLESLNRTYIMRLKYISYLRHMHVHNIHDDQHYTYLLVDLQMHVVKCRL